MKNKKVLSIIMSGVLAASFATAAFASTPDEDSWQALEYMKRQELDTLNRETKARKDAQAAGKTDYSEVFYRVYEPDGTKRDTNPYEIYTRGTNVIGSIQKGFNNKYSNYINVVELPKVTERARFTVEYKATGFNKNNIVLYHYDNETGVFNNISDPDIFTYESNITFSTSKGGYVIISNGALK